MFTLGWLKNEIETEISRWKRDNGDMDFWRSPLVGVASPTDPLIGRLKLVVDPEHAAAFDILTSAKSAAVFFLPFQRWIGEENDRSGTYSARI